jgi:hypothetical protein
MRGEGKTEKRGIVFWFFTWIRTRNEEARVFLHAGFVQIERLWGELDTRLPRDGNVPSPALSQSVDQA